MIKKIEHALSAIDNKYLTVDKINYERMFQFELYHQIKMQNIEQTDLTPEFKKESKYFRENPFSETIGNYIPDLLIHNFNNRENQNIAIEIKSINRNNMNSIYNDIKKLMCYCHNSANALNYRIGLLILYDGDFIKKYNRVRIYKSKIKDLFNYTYNPVEIWLLKENHSIIKYAKEYFQRGYTPNN